MPRPPASVYWHAFLLAALYSTSLHAGTYSHNFNSLATDTPNGAISTSLVLGGGQLNGTTANATLISNRKDTNGAGTINVGIVKTGVGTAGATALRLADKATGSATAALVLPVIDANATVTEFTVSLKLLMDRTAGATPADGFNISFGQSLSGLGGSGGHGGAYGLTVNFDTFSNSTADPRSIEVFADGVSVGNFLAASLPGGDFRYDQTFRDVVLHWDVNGLEPGAALSDPRSAVITAATSLGIQLPADAPPGSEIRYTLNTAEPTESSPLYTTPIEITSGVLREGPRFRARPPAIQDGQPRVHLVVGRGRHERHDAR